jgi:peptidase E
MTVTRQIIAIGGATSPADVALFPYVLAQARRPTPRVGLLATASGDSDVYVGKFYERFSPLPCQPTHLPLFGRVPRLEPYIAEQDVILVSGGNTKSMLAVWRNYGLDLLLRQAWEAGSVLSGFSAGAICWFSEGLSDAWADRLVPVPGLGLLDGSCCPHYSNEPARRPDFRRLVGHGEIAAGLAIDDGAAVHFRDTNAVALVTSRREANAYRVAASQGVVSETALAIERIHVGAD